MITKFFLVVLFVLLLVFLMGLQNMFFVCILLRSSRLFYIIFFQKLWIIELFTFLKEEFL